MTTEQKHLLIQEMARTSQLLMDSDLFEDCETLEDFIEARDLLLKKAVAMASKPLNNVLERVNA